MKLNSDEKLVLNFDLLGDQPETYYYTFIHCDKDWKKSDIIPNDYMSGDTENPLRIIKIRSTQLSATSIINSLSKRQGKLKDFRQLCPFCLSG